MSGGEPSSIKRILSGAAASLYVRVTQYIAAFLYGGVRMQKALYREYRPATFSDVVGQEYVVATLRNQLRTGKLSHAYLFTGSRGTGKTSIAKIVAKAANCENLQDGEPCLSCEVCRGIEDGSILDVTEIDAASNNGVDNIRELRDEAFFAPVRGRYRVYIIDEVHMLSTSAFNALLKIMEEPPEHVLFILATTEVHKVPATILSRCQRFDFRRIRPEEIAGRIEQIAEKEQFTIEPQAALLIGRVADGSVRDALSITDSCLSYGGDITEQLVRERLGIADKSYLYALCEAVLREDSAEALRIVGELYAGSKDMLRLSSELMGFYRDLLVVKTGGGEGELSTADDLERLKSLADGMGLGQLTYSLTLLSQLASFPGANPRMQLELTLIKLCKPELDGSAEALLRRLERLEKGVPVRTAEPARGVPAHPEQGKKAAPPSPAGESVPEEAVRTPPPGRAQPTPADGQEQAFDLWPEVLEKLKALNGPLFGALASSRAYIQGERVLIDCDNPLFLELVRNSEQAKTSLRRAIEMVTGKVCGLSPYRRTQQRKPTEQADPLDAFTKRAEDIGVDIKVEK